MPNVATFRGGEGRGGEGRSLPLLLNTYAKFGPLYIVLIKPISCSISTSLATYSVHVCTLYFSHMYMYIVCANY